MGAIKMSSKCLTLELVATGSPPDEKSTLTRLLRYRADHVAYLSDVPSCKYTRDRIDSLSIVIKGLTGKLHPAHRFTDETFSDEDET